MWGTQISERNDHDPHGFILEKLGAGDYYIGGYAISNFVLKIQHLKIIIQSEMNMYT